MNELEKFTEKFLEKIESYDKITIFCHVQPDYDAYASAFGIYQWLLDNYQFSNPGKKYYLMIYPDSMTYQEKILFEYHHSLPNDQDISESLGIVVDTANELRVMTQKHKLCKELINIDHHPQVDNFATINFIDPIYPACSQIIATMFTYLEPNYVFTSKVAQYLYAGIVTDTNNLLSPTVSTETFNILGKIVAKGINRDQVIDAIFLKTLNQKQFDSYVLKRINITANGLAYVIISKQAIKKYKIEHSSSAITLLANLLNVEVWTTLSYEPGHKKWKASIRSKHLDISNIAQEFGGGGHRRMAAVLFNNIFSYYKMLARIEEYLLLMGYGRSGERVKTKSKFQQLLIKKYKRQYQLNNN